MNNKEEYRIVSVEWYWDNEDLDNMEVTAKEIVDMLPDEEVKVPARLLDDDDDGIVCDYLSDEYGWLVSGWCE
jgi:hypothetical protein